MNEIEIPSYLMPRVGTVWEGTGSGTVILITAVIPDRVYYQEQGIVRSMPAVRWLDMEALQMFKRI